MKKVLFFLSLALTSGNVHLKANTGDPVFQWAKLIDGPSAETPHSLAKSNDGKIFAFSSFGTKGTQDLSVSYDGNVVGYGAPYQGTSSAGSANVLFQKLDTDGTQIWCVYSNWGAVSLSDCAYTPTIDGGAMLALKMYHTDADAAGNHKLLSLVDATGASTEVIWEKPACWAYQGVLVKISTDGRVEWAKRIDVDTSAEPAAGSSYASGTSDGIYFYGMAADEDGQVYLAGNYRKTVTFVKPDATEVKLTPHNTAGWNGDSQKAVGDLFFVKLDKDGNYLGHLTTTGEAERESIDDIVYDRGKLYFLGRIKGKSGEEAGTIKTLAFGATTLEPTAFDDLIAGAIRPDLTVDWVRSYPAFAASNGKHTTLNKKLEVQNGCLYLTGHVAGGFGKDKKEALVRTSGTLQEGFIIRCSATDGEWLGGTTHGSTISGYYGAFERDGKVYTYGYRLSNSVFLVIYDKETFAPVIQYDLVTEGTLTGWGCLCDGNRFFSFSRCNAAAAFYGTDLTLGSTGWGSVLCSFELPKSSATEIYGSVDDSAFRVSGGKGVIRLVSSERCRVTVYNTGGQPVKTFDMPAGETTEMLPQGIYLVNGKKAVVF